MQPVRQGRDIGSGTIGAIDQAEYRIGAGARVKSVLHALCADRPAGLRLVTGEARAPIGSKILKKSVARRLRIAVWLIARNYSARVGIHRTLWNGRRRWLRTGIDIVVGTHPLQMNHRVQSPGGIGDIVRRGLRPDGRR